MSNSSKIMSLGDYSDGSDSDKSEIHEVFDNSALSKIVDTEKWVFKENQCKFGFLSLFKARAGLSTLDRINIDNEDIIQYVKNIYNHNKVNFPDKKSAFNFVQEQIQLKQNDNYNYTILDNQNQTTKKLIKRDRKVGSQKFSSTNLHTYTDYSHDNNNNNNKSDMNVSKCMLKSKILSKPGLFKIANNPKVQFHSTHNLDMIKKNSQTDISIDDTTINNNSILKTPRNFRKFINNNQNSSNSKEANQKISSSQQLSQQKIDLQKQQNSNGTESGSNSNIISPQKKQQQQSSKFLQSLQNINGDSPVKIFRNDNPTMKSVQSTQNFKNLPVSNKKVINIEKSLDFLKGKQKSIPKITNQNQNETNSLQNNNLSQNQNQEKPIKAKIQTISDILQKQIQIQKNQQNQSQDKISNNSNNNSINSSQSPQKNSQKFTITTKKQVNKEYFVGGSMYNDQKQNKPLTTRREEQCYKSSPRKQKFHILNKFSNNSNNNSVVKGSQSLQQINLLDRQQTVNDTTNLPDLSQNNTSSNLTNILNTNNSINKNNLYTNKNKNASMMDSSYFHKIQKNESPIKQNSLMHQFISKQIFKQVQEETKKSLEEKSIDNTTNVSDQDLLRETQYKNQYFPYNKSYLTYKSNRQNNEENNNNNSQSQSQLPSIQHKRDLSLEQKKIKNVKQNQELLEKVQHYFTPSPTKKYHLSRNNYNDTNNNQIQNNQIENSNNNNNQNKNYTFLKNTMTERNPANRQKQQQSLFNLQKVENSPVKQYKNLQRFSSQSGLNLKINQQYYNNSNVQNQSSLTKHTQQLQSKIVNKQLNNIIKNVDQGKQQQSPHIQDEGHQLKKITIEDLKSFKNQ